MFTYKQLQDEIKRGALRDQGGTVYDTAVRNIINRALLRLNREAGWRSMRKKAYLTTKTSYTTGSGAVTATNGSTAVTITGATLLTDGIQRGRRIKISGSGLYYIIRQITGETTLVLDRNYDGTTTATGTYEIYPQEEYNLPIQAGHRLFLWHEAYGYPYIIRYVPDQSFYETGVQNVDKNVPTNYRMWGEDMVIEQVRTPSVISVVSSDASDSAIPVTVFGVVSGYPDYEIINTNSTSGTTISSGTKVFSSVERVVKGATTVGRITVTANTASTTVAVIPTGSSTLGIRYRKIQLWPLPNTAFDINAQYYKDPYFLVNDGDIHELGAEFDQAIIYLSIAILKYENNQDEGDKFAALYKNEIRSLRTTNADKIDWLPRLRKPKDSHGPDGILVNRWLSYSQVGSNYGPVV